MPRRTLVLTAYLALGCTGAPRENSDAIDTPALGGSLVVEESSTTSSAHDETTTDPSLVVPEDLDLATAVGLSHSFNPELRRVAASVLAAGGRALQAGLLSNPELSVIMESARFSGRTTGDADYLVTVTQPVPLSGRLGAGREAGEAERRRLLAALERAKLEVEESVRVAFADALAADELVTLGEERRSTAESMAQLARRQVAAGSSVPEVVHQADTELGLAELALLDLRRQREATTRRLARAIGLEEASWRRIEGTLETGLGVPTPEELEALWRAAPRALENELSVEEMEARLRLAEASRVRDVTIGLGYRYIGADNDNAFDVWLGVPLPIFDRGQGSVATAQADLDAARATVTSLRRELRDAVKSVAADLRDSLEAVRIYEARMEPASHALLDTARRRFDEGELSLYDLLVAQRKRLEQREAYLRARLRAVHRAAQLRALTGYGSSDT